MQSANMSVLDLSNVETIAKGIALSSNWHLKKIIAPKLKSTGSLFLSDNSALTTLDFPALVTIDGVVTVTASSFTQLTFAALSRVGSLVINRNTPLQDVQFPALTAASNVTITQNSRLVSVGLGALDSTGLLRISGSHMQQIDLTALRSVKSLLLDSSDRSLLAPPANDVPLVEPWVKLNSLQTVVTLQFAMMQPVDLTLQLTQASSVTIMGGLTKLQLPALTNVGSLTITSTTALKAITAPVLKTVTVKLLLDDCDGLETVDFAGLTEVRGIITLQDTSAISMSFQALSKVFQTLTIAAHPRLAKLSMPALTQVFASFNLATCPMLQNVDLSKFQSAGRLLFGAARLFAEGEKDHEEDVIDPRKASLVGTLDLVLPSMTNCTYLFIKYDTTLQSFSAPELVKFTTTTGTAAYFHVQGSTLQSISVPKVENIGATLHFSDNPRLTTLSFPKLSYVKKVFTISDCDALKTVTLEKLYQVDSYLKVQDCYALERVELPTLNTVREDLVVTRTPKLTYVNLRSLRTVGSYNNMGLYVRDLLGNKACVDLDCFEQIQIFDVYWCAMRNTTAPKCDQERHWNCACP